MDIEFIASMSVIAAEPAESRRLFVEAFGLPEWPSERTVPQASIEFEVADAGAVATAAEELEQDGFELLYGARDEPWGQTVARLQSVDSLIVGISYAPWLHR